MVSAFALWLIAAALPASSNTADPPKPLVTLIQDLDAAVAHAHLTDTQQEQLRSDRTVLESARVARERGDAVDRRQVAGAVKHIHKIVESHVFIPADAQAIDADIDALRTQSK